MTFIPAQRAASPEPDQVAVLADDAVIEQVRHRQPVTDPLGRRLAAWRDDVDATPIPGGAS